jgi:hypothetical protein
MNLSADTSNKKKADINAALFAELFFNLLPIVILFIALSYTGSPLKIFSISEWSFATAILSGQSMVKFINGLLKFGKPVNLGATALVISLIIVFLLAPSLVILTLIIISPLPIYWLSIVQGILFILAVLAFLFLGYFSEIINGQIKTSK